jgi:hypothetical protein
LGLQAFLAAHGGAAQREHVSVVQNYWSRCNIKWTWRFRTGYWGLFRGFSVFVHPTVAGIDPFISTEARGAAVGIPRAAHRGDVQVDAVLCFADALAVASHRLGWPSIGEVLAAFTNGFRPEKVP